MKRVFMRFFNWYNSKYDSEKLYDMVMISLFAMLVTCLAIVVASQIALRNEKSRVYLTNISKYENMDAVNVFSGNNTDNSYVDILIENCLEDDVDNVSVYVNGDYYEKFSTNRKRVYVNTQSVIEIKNDNSYVITAETENYGKNLKAVLDNGKISVSGISILSRVLIN